ncbi:acyl carrier protein [Flavobacterium sp.]|jgi:acyl carrier protein|uniref:acyl carrier protein n=1 Tax=Flavobacterium sp. TaxID=239 RepID=UPI0037C166AA
MDESKFLENFCTIFDDVEVGDLTMKTHFKELDEWSSLAALGLLAVVCDEYDVELNYDDIKNAVTIQDIYNNVINH